MMVLNILLPILLICSTIHADTTQCTHGTCGPGNDLCIVGNPIRFVFHLSDIACAINDPNGPFYDPVHKVYHNFYQDHLAEPSPVGLKAGQGPDWGHWVSRDFLHWARLPVAIWNDQWYDNSAIYTGSATIVDGKPIIVYPGKCIGTKGTPEGDACSTGFTYDVAVPTDPSDPLYTNWTKPAYNPIVNSTGDDPSTAWQTTSGEWRMIGNQKCGNGTGTPIYGSLDFKSWYKIGCTTLLLGDCPTFFPLPALVDIGRNLSKKELLELPTHVHKSGDPADHVQVGVWTEGKPGPEAKGGTPGTWVQYGDSIPLDNGATHASKDFYDPVKKRRIMWVWALVRSGAHTVPREMKFDPRIGRIVYNPVEEMLSLRSTAPIDMLMKQTITSSDAPLTFTGGNAIDVEIVWDLPTVSVSLEVSIGDNKIIMEYINNTNTMKVQLGNNHNDVVPIISSDTQLTLRLMVDVAIIEAYFQDGRVVMTNTIIPDDNIMLRVNNATFTPSRAYEYMSNYDLPGGDYMINNTFGIDNKDPKTCQRLCEADDNKCKSWTFVAPGVQMKQARCCLKNIVPDPVFRTDITSGALGTGPMPSHKIGNNAVATLISAKSWSMSSIWTTKEQVLLTPPAVEE